MGMTGLACHNGFMTYPRSHIVAEGESGYFHVVSHASRHSAKASCTLRMQTALASLPMLRSPRIPVRLG